MVVRKFCFIFAVNKQTYNMQTSELTKKDWANLIEFGLVDGEGNGFANTTKKADDNLNISAHRNTFVKLKGKHKVFVVRYYSGCFYPMWYVAHEINQVIKIITK